MVAFINGFNSINVGVYMKKLFLAVGALVALSGCAHAEYVRINPTCTNGQEMSIVHQTGKATKIYINGVLMVKEENTGSYVQDGQVFNRTRALLADGHYINTLTTPDRPMAIVLEFSNNSSFCEYQ